MCSRRISDMDIEPSDIKMEPPSSPTDQLDSEIQVEEMDIKPIVYDLLKVEPTEETQINEQYSTVQSDAVVHGNGETAIQARRTTAADIIAIKDLFHLFEEFKTMATSERSVACSQSLGCHVAVHCPVCGAAFIGLYDNIAQLYNHFQLAHSNECVELTFADAISYMRRALDFDERVVSVIYQNRG
ncbi:uncharacterized protein LOC113214720 [Frankliniella occidentalis]|uniref:Uncharacterized protein LOC113214720 n=1 Tax=Frankliniella occidentalis TaxID=133901 RepID=A0A6J1T9J3_FRAOC|nr:uncharacterized protein LOC113214720 [Frankliniella occidentalis]